MFSVISRDGPIPTLELIDDSTPSLVVIAPRRGGMVTRFSVAGREIFYLDRATLDDPTANVRGGNPVLFPSPGKLVGDRWSRGGLTGSMKQHGFARNLPWEVSATETVDSASAQLTLCSSEITRAQYPWDFRADYVYSLRAATLRIDMTFTNQSATPMPFGAGFHPYFAITSADKGRARIDARASRAFDNVTKREVPFSGFDFGLPEVDMHLLDHPSSESSIAIEGDPGSRVAISGSPEFRRWVVWSLAGRDFICLEPWTCPGNALNSGEDLMHIAPGGSISLWISYQSGAATPRSR